MFTGDMSGWSMRTAARFATLGPAPGMTAAGGQMPEALERAAREQGCSAGAALATVGASGS